MSHEELTRFDLQEVLFGPNSMNGAIRTSKATNEFNIVPNNVSVFRDVTPGNGSVSFDALYDVSTPAQTDGNQALETARLGQYRPGSNSTMGIYVQKESPPVGTAEWGLGRDGMTDGAYFRYKSDDTYELVVEQNGSEIVIPRELWSDSINERVVQDDTQTDAGVVYGFDSMDGTGDSGITLDIADGFVFIITYAWYGGGPVMFSLLGVDDDGYQREHPICQYEPRGRPPFDQPNQPLFARLDNDGTATTDSMKVGGRQYTIFGDHNRRNRTPENIMESESVPAQTAYTPIIALRRKSGYDGVEFDFQEVVTQTDNTLHIKISVDPTFNTSPNWGVPTDHDADEVAHEVAELPDANEDGTKYTGYIAGSGKNDEALAARESVDFPFPRQKPIVVYARSLANDATTSFSTVIDEAW